MLPFWSNTRRLLQIILSKKEIKAKYKLHENQWPIHSTIHTMLNCQLHLSGNATGTVSHCDEKSFNLIVEKRMCYTV